MRRPGRTREPAIPPRKQRTLERLLAHARLPWLAAAAGVVLALPSITGGRFADDHIQHFMLVRPPCPPWLEGALRPRFALDLFHFFDGDPSHNDKLIELGVTPWWTSREAHAAFFRPVSAATHWLDYQLWPDKPLLMHVHSLLWYGGVVVLAGVLYRRTMSSAWAAGLAAVLYAVDDAHGTTIAFLANRNALVSTFFGVAALLSYERWTRLADPRTLMAALLWFALALLAAEGGIATLAYLTAHAVCLDRRPWRKRLSDLGWFVGLVAVWRIGWTLGGYGVADIGVYIDPLHDPMRFAVALLQRFPILLAAQFLGPPADLSILLGPRGMQTFSTVAAIACLGLVAAVVPLLRRDPVARFWGLGTVLAAVPVTSTFASDRLLMFVGVGAFGLLGQAMPAFAAWAKDAARPATRRLARGAWASVLAIHALLAPILLPLRVGPVVGTATVLGRVHVRTPMDAAVERQTVVIVNAPMALVIGSLPITRALEGSPVPRRVRLLSPSGSAVQLSRPDERTLIVRPDPPYLTGSLDQLFRSPNHPMRQGEVLALPEAEVEVSQLGADGRASEVRFRFRTRLEDASLRWLMWDRDEFRAMSPPAVGEVLSLPPALPF
ncbi:MAG: hypothetical protein HY763_09900 [Planctomycetes bacterium]|nr:hypothetical protein [Planctomycetota bacterium]